MPSKAVRQQKINQVIELVDNNTPELVDAQRHERFLLWAVDLFLESSENPPSTDDLLQYITDGKDDLEIDAYYIDEDETQRVVYLFQSKFTEAPGNVRKKDVSDFKDAPSRLSSPDHLQHCTNEKIKELAPLFREKVMDGFDLQLVFLTTRSLTQAIRKEVESWESQDLILNYDGVEVIPSHSMIICDLDELLDRRGIEPEPTSINIELQLMPGEWYSTSVDGYDCLFATISGEQLASLYKDHKQRLFKYNPRNWLGRKPVNKDIAETLGDEKQRGLFLLLNNGISALCREFTAPAPTTTEEIFTTSIRDFQIVNGCQTTVNIYNHWSGLQPTQNVSVTLKLVSGLTDEMRGKLSRASNSQSAMKDWDYLFDNPIQVRLQKDFQEMISPPVFYELKRGERQYGAKKGQEVVTVKNIAQTTYAFLGYPGEAKDKIRDIPRSRNDSNGTYSKVFFGEVTPQYLYLPWLVYKRVLKNYQEYVKQTGQKGDYREYSRLHVLWLIGRAITARVLGKTEQEAYKEIQFSDLNGIIDSIDSWFAPANEMALKAIRYQTDVAIEAADGHKEPLQLRNLFRGQANYPKFANAHDRELAEAPPLPIEV